MACEIQIDTPLCIDIIMVMKNPLTVVPGVGKSIAEDLNGIGIFRVEELKGKDPEVLYLQICDKQGAVIR